MNKYIFITFVFLGFSISAFSNINDTISTTYKDGEYITLTKVWVNAPSAIMDQVIDDFLHQTKYDLETLMHWGLKGLKLRSEKDDLIVFNFKTTRYDKKNDIIEATGEVIVPKVIRFPEIHVNSKMTKKTYENGKVNVDINVLYSDAFLSKTTGNFNKIPIDQNECYLTLETKVKFGWFFNIFITKYTFTKIMEWRFKTLMYNLKLEAEKRS